MSSYFSDVYWWLHRERVLQDCVTYAAELYDLLLQLPPGHPLEAGCIGGIKGAEEVLQQYGLTLFGD